MGLLELKSKFSSELLKLNASKIFGEDIGSVILAGDKENFNLALSYVSRAVCNLLLLSAILLVIYCR